MPRCWAAKQMTVVVPPKAAAVVALSKVSALTMPAAERCSIWACASMPPGSTNLAPGVDLAGAGGQVAADGDDRPAADADVGVELVHRRADPASAHHAVVLGLRHGHLLRSDRQADNGAKSRTAPAGRRAASSLARGDAGMCRSVFAARTKRCSLARCHRLRRLCDRRHALPRRWPAGRGLDRPHGRLLRGLRRHGPHHPRHHGRGAEARHRRGHRLRPPRGEALRAGCPSSSACRRRALPPCGRWRAAPWRRVPPA